MLERVQEDVRASNQNACTRFQLQEICDMLPPIYQTIHAHHIALCFVDLASNFEWPFLNQFVPHIQQMALATGQSIYL